MRDEDDYIELVENGDFDVIYADHCMERMTPKFDGDIRGYGAFCSVWSTGVTGDCAPCIINMVVHMHSDTNNFLWLLRHRLSLPSANSPANPAGSDTLTGAKLCSHPRRKLLYRPNCICAIHINFVHGINVMPSVYDNSRSNRRRK